MNPDKYVNLNDILKLIEANKELIEKIKEELDYIKVTYCKNCIHKKELGGYANSIGYLICKRTGCKVNEDCFCSWGEV